MATLHPPLADLGRLEPRLNAGEMRVAAALSELDDTWTIYVQPRLDMDIPDFVAVHDRYGVCAIEVKDWSPRKYRQSDCGSIEYITGDGVWHACDEQPRYQAYRYRSTIFDQYFARPEDNGHPTQDVRAVLILPQFSNHDARQLLARRQVTDDEFSVGIYGGDGLIQSLEGILRGTGCPTPRKESMDRLRRHMSGSEALREIRTPATLSPDAKNIADNPRDARRRRIRGPAGCGKTFGLAARAARLAADGKTVLLLAYNTTLSHYLHSLTTARCQEYGADPRLVATMTFHGFCRRVVDDAVSIEGLPVVDRCTGDEFEQIIGRAQHAFELGLGCRFDAVLIDEGQDFTLDWWNMLRHHVVADDGEMVLVSDPTQDVYGNKSWTDEEQMIGSGFSGPWTELSGSYRLPSDLVPIANSFATRYLDGELLTGTVPTDRAEISGRSGVTIRHWENIDRPQELGAEIGREVVRLLAAHPVLSPSDVVFLCETHDDGLAAVAEIEAAGHQVCHMFARYEGHRAQRKRRFWPNAPGIKGCTVHSFKGWEARALVMGIGKNTDSRRLAYVAMTRVKSDSEGGQSFLSVVNSDLADVAKFHSTFVEWGVPVAALRMVELHPA